MQEADRQLACVRDTSAVRRQSPSENPEQCGLAGTITANDGNFLLPIPNVELSQAPNLQKDPVEYP